MSRLTIYHGSISIIERPVYGKGKPYNDYGLGFYCTESRELAKEWAVSEDQDGYANTYILDTDDLRILDLSAHGFTTLHWISLLLQYRTFTVKSDIAKDGKDYLVKHFSIPIDEYDVIKGYRADDSYFAYAQSFLDNTITVQRLAEALRLGNLGEQVVLKSKAAFEHLRFIGYELAEADIYYALRKDRNDRARNEFLKDRRGPLTEDAMFLSDIIRGGIPADDPRIQ